MPLSSCFCSEPGILILTNSIYNNQRLGIDITTTINTTTWEGNGTTPNDDPDINFAQNYPVITSATATRRTARWSRARSSASRS